MSDIRINAHNRALSQVGVTEKANNYNIFARDLKGVKAPQNAPYCAIGNAWSYAPWIDLTKCFSLPWYVPGVWADAKRRGWTTSNPVVGDIVIYDWTRNNDPDHTGIVSYGPRKAVEFNTSPTNAGSQGNGGGVYLRTREARVIVGYISVSAICKTMGWDLDQPDVRPIVRKGAQGSHVKDVQRSVGVAVDGSYGPATLVAVKAYQARHGLTVDGVVGASTWKAFGASIPKPVTPSLVRIKLRRGDRGPSVGEVQRIIGAKVDNVFGAETEAKVKAYQAKHKLKADGVIGAATWSKLLGRPVHVS